MIQWYPGHMAKTLREMEADIKLVDFVIELLDARAPLSSQNPVLQDVIQEKPKIILLMKSDLADEQKTEAWLSYFRQQDVHVLAMDSDNPAHIRRLLQLVDEIGAETLEEREQKGIQRRTLRSFIVGVPNVGKSTLINRLAKKRIANIGARPGITRHTQWVKINKDFELLDTPGVLWPKFEDELVGMTLAMIGTIKYELVPAQDVTAHLLNIAHEYYPQELEKRYSLTQVDDMWDVFVHIGKQRGALERGGQVNFDKVAEIVLQDFRSGRLGRMTLEECPIN